MWFKQLTGFEEKNPEFVRENLEIREDYFISKINNEKFYFGRLETPTLKDLRDSNILEKTSKAKITVKEIVANVQELHKDIENSNAIFQAASQFNLLEMVSPRITPEMGIDRYENDRTQGPACAIACGAGTIYRNYFVEVGNKVGQTSANQIDCLDLIGDALENGKQKLWSMENGYALASQEGLLTINEKLESFSAGEREELKGKLKIGIQSHTDVTISKEKHKVTQVYCSALPVAYSNVESEYWEPFARLILEATYEATFYTALKNMEKTGCNLVYLTLVGGGAFGNEESWIFNALEAAILKFKFTSLDIRIVSYGRSNPRLVEWVSKVNKISILN